MDNLPQKIEAILFYKGEPVSFSVLAKICNTSVEEVRTAAEELTQSLNERGLRILEHDDAIMLGTAPDFSETIETLIKEELHKDLGKAGLETLAIILYLGPITRARVDYIRGVNSTFILRNLGVRGLVERAANPGDQRSFLYQPTFDLLSHLGVTRVTDLPDYEDVRNEITLFEKEQEAQKRDNNKTEDDE